MIIIMLFYLINVKMGKIAFLFEFGYILFRGVGVNHPFLWHFCIWYTIYTNVYIALLSYTIAYIQNINLKGNAEKKATGEHQACFPLNFT